MSTIVSRDSVIANNRSRLWPPKVKQHHKEKHNISENRKIAKNIPLGVGWGAQGATTNEQPPRDSSLVSNKSEPISGLEAPNLMFKCQRASDLSGSDHVPA